MENFFGVLARRMTTFLVSNHYINTGGGARGVMVIVTGYGHGDPSSIPGQD